MTLTYKALKIAVSKEPGGYSWEVKLKGKVDGSAESEGFKSKEDAITDAKKFIDQWKQ